MAFSVVQTRKNKKSKPCLTIVPSKWVENGVVFWPQKNFISLSMDENSTPDESWTQQPCKTVGRSKTYSEAEDIVNRLEMVTDSEDAQDMTQGTRGKPARKKTKFEAKSYNLAPPLIKRVMVKSTPPTIESTFQETVSATISNPQVSPTSPTNLVEIPGKSYREKLSAPDPTFTPQPFALEDTNPPRNLLESVYRLETHPTQPQQQALLPKSIPSSQEIVFPKPSIAGPGHPSGIGNSENSNMSSQSHILSGSDGKQYFSLGNGCYMEVILPETNADETLIGNEPRYSSLDPTNLKPEKCDDDSYDDGMENSDIVSQLKTLNSRVEAVEARLDQLLVFMANIEKFITTRSAASASKEQKREPEDFGEFKKLCPILSEDQLQMVEHNLKNKPFADKFFRFFESEYNLNGKRDGRAFMKTILRRIVAPTILLPFSWKGNSRRTTDAVPFTPNRSFKDTFPEFVEFVQRIASAADMLHTAEQSDQCFSQFLRQKKVEVTRFLEGQGNRVVSSRKRKAKPQEEQHEENEENDGVEDM